MRTAVVQCCPASGGNAHSSLNARESDHSRGSSGPSSDCALPPAGTLQSSVATSGEASTPLSVIGRHAPVVLHTVSSQISSAISTCGFYPFDILKTRFMSQDGTAQRQHNGRTYHSITRSLTTIYREEGLRTLFRGCGVAVFGSVTAWGLYMLLYRELCNLTEFTSFVSRSGISVIASLMSSFISCPIFFLKSRMQLEESTRSAHYRTFRGGLVYTLRTSGVRSLWRGASLQLFLVFPSAFGIPTYDFLKAMMLSSSWRRAARGGEMPDLNIAEVCLCSGAAKVLLMILTHPLVMLKVRLQDQRAQLGAVQYRTVLQSVATIIKMKGVKGMYRGFTATLVHSLPRSLTHYILYEKTLNLLCKQYGCDRK